MVKPQDSTKLTGDEKKGELPCLIFLTEKRDLIVKVRIYIDNSKQ